MNCFLACRLPADSAAHLADYVAAELGPIPGVQWVTHDKFHVTTEFFGNQDSSAFCARVSGIVEPVCAGYAPMELAFDRLGSFSRRDNPHAVLYAGIADTDGALEDLVREIRAVLQDQGIAGERSAFVPHCTIGRTHHSLKDAAALRWEQACLKEIGGQTFAIPSLSLMQTVPGNGGSRYESVCELPFSARR